MFVHIYTPNSISVQIFSPFGSVDFSDRLPQGYGTTTLQTDGQTDTHFDFEGPFLFENGNIVIRCHHFMSSFHVIISCFHVLISSFNMLTCSVATVNGNGNGNGTNGSFSVTVNGNGKYFLDSVNGNGNGNGFLKCR